MDIKRDKQIKKFCWYGFLKNLKFFEPYLIIYLNTRGLSLFYIGLLYTIREIVIYLFEVPSGVFADKYGKKTELMLCFVFYIISFIGFFLGRNFLFFSVSMFFFGLGESLRSGTHKAMIMAYLDKNNIIQTKAIVYGYTRSYSLIGAMISSVLALLFIIKLPYMSWIFIICIIPYIGDFFLIMSYPSYLNEKGESKFNFKNFIYANYEHIKYTFTNRKIIATIVNSSSFDGIFKTVKDYIQPILSQLILASGIGIIAALTKESQVKVTLGIIYAIMYAASAVASKKAHILLKKFNINKSLYLIWALFATTCFITGILIDLNQIIGLLVIYLLMYIFKNIRRPLMVDKLGNIINADKRTSALSIESQLKSLIVAVIAPLLGLLADNISISSVFYVIAATMGIFTLIKLLTEIKSSRSNC